MRRDLAMLIGFAAVASTATAAEFVPGVESTAAWNSNVFQSAQNEEAGPSLLFGPNFELREEQGALQYDVQYRLRYEYFPTLSGINDFQHFVDANASYRFAGATTLSVRESFTKASSAYQTFTSQGTAANGLVQVASQNARQELLVNSAGATLTHMFTPRWQGQLNFDYSTFDYPQNNQIGVEQSHSASMVGSAQLTNALTPRLTAGFGSSVTRQTFETAGGQQGRGTTIYNGFGIVNYKLTPTLTFSASAGPAIDNPDELNVPPTQVVLQKYPFQVFRIGGTDYAFPYAASSCPVVGGLHVLSSSCKLLDLPVDPNTIAQFTTRVGFLGPAEKVQPTLTYYGHISLDKRWENVSASLTYSRTTSTASGLAASTNLDSVTGSLTWTPTQFWVVAATASYNRQTSASKSQQPLIAITPVTLNGYSNIAQTIGVTSKLVNNAIEYDTYSVQLNVARRLSKRLTLNTGFAWWTQTSSGQFQANETREDFRVTLGLTYTFTPIPLWTKDL